MLVINVINYNLKKIKRFQYKKKFNDEFYIQLNFKMKIFIIRYLNNVFKEYYIIYKFLS